MLIVEESIDAIIGLLVTSKAVSAKDAGVMIGSLASRLEDHAEGKIETDWAVHAPEMREQAARLSARAAAIQNRRGDHA